MLPWNHLGKVFPKATARVVSKGWEALALRGRCSHGATDSGKLLYANPWDQNSSNISLACSSFDANLPAKGTGKGRNWKLYQYIRFSSFDGTYRLTRLVFKRNRLYRANCWWVFLPSLQIRLKQRLWLHIQRYIVGVCVLSVSVWRSCSTEICFSVLQTCKCLIWGRRISKHIMYIVCTYIIFILWYRVPAWVSSSSCEKSRQGLKLSASAPQSSGLRWRHLVICKTVACW